MIALTLFHEPPSRDAAEKNRSGTFSPTIYVNPNVIASVHEYHYADTNMKYAGQIDTMMTLRVPAGEEGAEIVHVRERATDVLAAIEKAKAHDMEAVQFVATCALIVAVIALLIALT